MKVIKKGTPPEEKMHRARCWRCGAVLEFPMSEAGVSLDPRDQATYLIVQCPVCRYRLMVDEKTSHDDRKKMEGGR